MTEGEVANLAHDLFKRDGKIKQLESRIQKLREALSVYGDKDNWGYGDDYPTKDTIVFIENDEEMVTVEGTRIWYRGLIARRTLEEDLKSNDD